MKRASLLSLLALMLVLPSLSAAEPDSAYLFAYATQKNSGRNGLHIAWSIDRTQWHAIGPEHAYLKCDYGAWGAEKRVVSPYLFRAPDGMWHLVWSLNERDGAFAHAATENLIAWKRQSYPVVIQAKNCLKPIVRLDKPNGRFYISWESTVGSTTEQYQVTTSDFSTYSVAEPIATLARVDLREQIEINGTRETGMVHKVAWREIEALISAQQLSAYKQRLANETTAEDPVRFASLRPVRAKITADASQEKAISNLLMGIFYEDLNYAADGGLYAELIQNRGFEYALSDKQGRDASWNSYKAWKFTGKGSFTIDTLLPLHINNPHFAILQTEESGATLQNEGFDGIALRAGEKYHLSLFVRNPGGKKEKLTLRLVDKTHQTVASAAIQTSGSGWRKYETLLTAGQTVADARLEIELPATGTLHFDMISLFPQNTFKQRRNGLRADLAQAIADLHPRFVRFPGGCVAHGDGLHNMYRWKNTVGPLEARKPQRNIWNYHQSFGLGYFEYFQFCEDIGAEPIPVVPAGVPCQNSATGGAGQQGGIPMCEMDNYVQEVLDLIEYANGDKKSQWGKIRAEAGHPEPFNLKYIGVGNEDLISDIFEERFTLIYKAVKAKYPEITVIGTVGPFFEGTDYREGWDIARKLGVEMVDEHYYQTPGWFIYNQDFYDKYDRSQSKVYLGEYAAHLPGRPNNLETALSEALYLTSVERNGDIVSMASYAPLLAKHGHTNWNPDLIYFNNTEVLPTVGYWVQQLFGQHAGQHYYTGKASLSDNRMEVTSRVATSIVKDTQSGDLILKLVNMLPVAVESAIDLSSFGLTERQATLHLLRGRPDSKEARPVQSAITVSETFNYPLPPYSLSVIRIPANLASK
ncbi:MAG: alpha-L-arabinofuranosidase C-terminal domain-containing protein [Bacteroidales bacterium]